VIGENGRATWLTMLLNGLQNNSQRRSSKRNYSGATTSPHVGHSAQIPSVPSSRSYSTRIHAVVIRSSQFGQRPRFCVSSGMERGWKERVTVFLPCRTRPASRISVCQTAERMYILEPYITLRISGVGAAVTSGEQCPSGPVSLVVQTISTPASPGKGWLPTLYARINCGVVL